MSIRPMSLAMNLITSGLSGKIDADVERKVILLNIVHFTGLLALFPMGALAFYQGNASLGSLDWVMVGALIFNVVYLRKTGDHHWVIYFGIAIILVFYLFLLFTGGVNNTAYVWFYTFPLFALFLLGTSKGIAACFILFLPTLVFLLTDVHWPMFTTYSVDMKLRFIPSFLVVAAYSILFESMRARVHKKLVAKNLELEQTRLELEKANRAKGEFLATMSHELRTPLNHIIGFTKLVLDKRIGDLNEIQEEYLGDVVHSSQHLLSLINDVLDLAKVEAGKMELNLSEVALPQLLENSLVMIKEKALKHEIRLSTSLDGLPETIQADERKLKQVLYNLLSNAAKFTPDGGEISLTGKLVQGSHFQVADSEQTSTLLDAPGEFIKISVSDTGGGIQPEDLDRIFESFEQAENSISRTFQGTGLGLALTQQLVELHNGVIWAESEGKGQGSRFSFLLPHRGIQGNEGRTDLSGDDFREDISQFREIPK